MGIWKQAFNLQGLNQLGSNNLGSRLGIEFIAFSSDALWASMPVNQHTKQPFGLLHGGASVALAETLGSVASQLCLKDTDSMAVGVEINANHLKAARDGKVYGRVRPIRVGRQIHVWEIHIFNAKNQLICISRLTTSIQKIIK